MVSALLAIGSVAYGGGVVAEPTKLEAFGSYRAMQVTMNGQVRYVAVEPLNFESFAATEVREEFGGFLSIKYLGLEKDLKVEDSFFRADEIPRTVTDKHISMFMGEEYFQNKLLAIDYFNETLQVFESGDLNDAMTWLKAGSPDDEPTVGRVAMTKSLEDVWLTDQLKVDGEKWPLMPILMDSDSDQASVYEPGKWGELWQQYGSGGGVYSKSFWRNVEFGSQPLPFFIGSWLEIEKDLPGLRGSLAIRDLGSRRVLYDSSKAQIWFTQSSGLEQICAMLGNHVFRFPVRLVGKELKIGRVPRFDDSAGDGLCSGGTILSVDSYSGEEIVETLLAGGEKRQKLAKDLVQRSKQRVTVDVMCIDGKKRTVYVNSLLSYGG